MSIMKVKTEPKQVGTCCGIGVGVGAGVSEGTAITVVVGVGVPVSTVEPNNVIATSPGIKRYIISPPAPLVLV